jgi:hypothetical protein
VALAGTSGDPGMDELLKQGQVVQTQFSRQPCQVEKFLGGGGQGEVYSAQWCGHSYALKWYFPHTATEDQRESLEKLISEPGSRPSDAFLWPEDIAHASEVASCDFANHASKGYWTS